MKLINSFLFVTFLLVGLNTQAKSVYKCQKNGTTEFSETPCDSSATEVILKELSAPLKPMDMNALKGLDARAKVRKIEHRLSLRQKRIKALQKKMDKELKTVEIGNAQKKTGRKIKALGYENNIEAPKAKSDSGNQKKGRWAQKNTAKESHTIKTNAELRGLTEAIEHIGNDTAAMSQNMRPETVSEQKAVVISRYTLLIQQEQFQINILLQELFTAHQEEQTLHNH